MQQEVNVTCIAWIAMTSLSASIAAHQSIRIIKLFRWVRSLLSSYIYRNSTFSSMCDIHPSYQQCVDSTRQWACFSTVSCFDFVQALFNQ